jgi:threonine dehydratase
MTETLADIEAARRKLSGAILRTPMLPAPKLSAREGRRRHGANAGRMGETPTR